MRGAERTFAEIAALLARGADLHAALRRRRGRRGLRRARRAHLDLQRLGARQRGFRYLLPFFPAPSSASRCGGHDPVVSSSSAFAHGVRPDPGALHVCYCHSPFRYAWYERDRALAEAPRLARPLLDRTLRRIRAWDRKAASGSPLRRQLRDHPGTDRGDLRGRVGDRPPARRRRALLDRRARGLRPLRRPDRAAQAGRGGDRGRPDGGPPDQGRRRRAGPAAPAGVAPAARSSSSAASTTIALPISTLAAPRWWCRTSRSSGSRPSRPRPPGARSSRSAGAARRETVIDGRTGVLVDGEDPAALAEPLRDEDFGRFDPEAIRAHAQGFSAAAFRDRFKTLVERYVKEHEAET